MHPSLNMDDIIILLASELVDSGLKATAVSFACCCRAFGDPVLDMLWRTQDRLIPLLKCLPQGVWAEDHESFYFQRIPTRAEWISFEKYARRIRKLAVGADDDPVTAETILALQHRATITKEFLLPRLKTFECQCTTQGLVVFISLFLSPQTTEIEILFGDEPPAVAIASTIGVLPTLCPNLERIVLCDLDKSPVITDAVSDMLLACNRDTLRDFLVYSPMMEEAREVLYRLQNLSQLLVVIEGHTLLPSMVLPNLTSIAIEYDDHFDWLQGFRGAALDRLETVYFESQSVKISDFLREFERVARTTSIQNTLLQFKFYTSSLWDADLTPLLSFNRLKGLDIEFACGVDCSSGLNDNNITTLARAMPKLEVLGLCFQPCKTPAGVTVRGLVALASCCPHLSELRIHFRGDTLVDGAAMNAATANLPIDKPLACALTHLQVGNIPIPTQSAEIVAQALLKIFPCILNVKYTNPEWKAVAQKISEPRKSGAPISREGGEPV